MSNPRTPEDFLTIVQSIEDRLRRIENSLTQKSAAYTPTNVTTDRAFDADTVAVAELADVVGTLIADLRALGRLD